MTLRDYLTVDEVAAQLGLGARTIRTYIRDGRLRAVRMGKQYRITRADLEAFTGGPVGEPAGAEARRRHRGEASSVVSIDTVSPDLAHRISTILTASAATRQDRDRRLRIDTIYDADHQSLKVVVIGDLEAAGDALSLISALTKEN